MSFSITTDDSLRGGGVISDPTTGITQVAGFGNGVLPQIRNQYSQGTGSFQASLWYLAQRTVGATSYDNLNLTSGLSTGGVVQAFSFIKRVFIGLIAPDGTMSLQIGPQGQTHANALWFQAASANFYDTVYTSLLHDRPVTGYTVSAGSTDVLGIYNPGANPVTYAVWLLGN